MKRPRVRDDEGEISLPSYQQERQVAAIFYSLIDTCRMLDIDPTGYLLAASEVAIETTGEVLLPHEFKKQKR